MTSQTDLFGHAPAQASLFGEGEDRMQPPQRPTSPDPNVIRLRAQALLAHIKAAQRMPWTPKEAHMWQTVFPNWTRWLPDDEGEQLRFEFARELERLSKAA